MTDEKIIKNAERHKLGNCSQCDYKNYGSNCLHELLNDTIKLSNRQKAELSALYKIVNKQDEEISELNRKVASRENLEESFLKTTKEFDKRLEKTVKAERREAIKEFTERIKRYIDVGHLRPPTEICFSELAVIEMIDNLVKEMTKEKE